jgi:hypothetical protein
MAHFALHTPDQRGKTKQQQPAKHTTKIKAVTAAAADQLPLPAYLLAPADL